MKFFKWPLVILGTFFLALIVLLALILWGIYTLCNFNEEVSHGEDHHYGLQGDIPAQVRLTRVPKRNTRLRSLNEVQPQRRQSRLLLTERNLPKRVPTPLRRKEKSTWDRVRHLRLMPRD